MLDTYVAYPHLERVALDRRDPRLKPAGALRYWYLAQHLAITSRPEVFAAWDPAATSRSGYRRLLSQGNGVYWDLLPEREVWVYCAAELHARLELPLECDRRDRAALALPTADWHHAVAEGHRERLEAATGEPVTMAAVARASGLTGHTVRQLRRAARIRSQAAEERFELAA